MSVLHSVDCISSGVGESLENSWYAIILPPVDPLNVWNMYKLHNIPSSLSPDPSNDYLNFFWSSYLLGYGSIGITVFNLTNLESQMNRCPKLCPSYEVLKSKDGLERLSMAGMCHGRVCISLWCGVYASFLQS